MHGIRDLNSSIADTLGISPVEAILPTVALLLFRKLRTRRKMRDPAVIVDAIAAQYPDFPELLPILESLDLAEAELHHDLGDAPPLYEILVDPQLRKLRGQFYTPTPIVEWLLDKVKYNGAGDGLLLDPACGAGVFLGIAAQRKLRALRSHLEPADILKSIQMSICGLDRDPLACSLARLNLLWVTSPLWLQENAHLSEPFRIGAHDSPQYLGGTLLEMRGPVPRQGYHWVVGNPPFIEAKKLGASEKRLCRQLFPDICWGAFDYSVAFVAAGWHALNEEGRLGFVLPNKILVTRYASKMRKRLFSRGHLEIVADISRSEYFAGTAVYPILLVAQKRSATRSYLISTARSRGLPSASNEVRVPSERWMSIQPGHPWVCFRSNEERDLLFKILDSTPVRLGDIFHLKTTVSFHRKGMRERYISLTRPAQSGFPYLGGTSFARENEVKSYRVKWKGYWIRYAQEELRREKNPLPPLSNFLRPKVIFCQHARSMTAYADLQGRWITKDVYPIAFPISNEGGNELVKFAVGYSNSPIFDFIYGLVYRGIQISSGYLHYLPFYLMSVPLPQIEGSDRKEISRHVQRIQDEFSKDPLRGKAMQRSLQGRIDEIIGKAFGLTRQDFDTIKKTLAWFTE